MIWQKKTEPDLVRAVVENDLEAVKTFAGNRLLESEANWLGFNAIEIAHYLDRREALDLLLPGRWKKKIRVQGQGKWSMREFEDFFGVRYLSHLKFPSYEALVKTARRSTWIYRNTFLGKKMRWLAGVYGLELFSGAVANVEVRWIDEELGYGLFAGDNFEPDAFIAEYTGEVTPLDVVHGPENPYLLRYPRPFFSLNFLQVDAEKMGNETRFINHSFQPNLKTGIALDKGIFRSFFAARETIEKGTQLTFNYGSKYWRHHGEPLPL